MKSVNGKLVLKLMLQMLKECLSLTETHFYSQKQETSSCNLSRTEIGLKLEPKETDFNGF